MEYLDGLLYPRKVLYNGVNLAFVRDGDNLYFLFAKPKVGSDAFPTSAQILSNCSCWDDFLWCNVLEQDLFGSFVEGFSEVSWRFPKDSE